MLLSALLFVVFAFVFQPALVWWWRRAEVAQATK
jgi:hypothetical protein